jgi:hypothetical protein
MVLEPGWKQQMEEGYLQAEDPRVDISLLYLMKEDIKGK